MDEALQGQRQLKEFESLTVIKKVATDAIGPLVKKIEGHVQVMLAQGERFRQDNERLAKVHKFQSELQSRMNEQTLNLEVLRKQLYDLKNQQQSNESSTNNNFELKNMEVAELKKQLAKKGQKIDEVHEQNARLRQTLSNMRQGLQEAIGHVQNKLVSVTQQTQMHTTMTQNLTEDMDRRLKQAEQLIRQSSQNHTQANRKLTHYESERQDIQAKMDQLFKHIFSHVSVQEFQRFKKHQGLELKATLQRVQQVVDTALTPEIRKFLPSVIENVEQLKKVLKLEQKQQILESAIEERHSNSIEQLTIIRDLLLAKITQLRGENSQQSQQLQRKLLQSAQNLTNTIESKLDKVEKQKILQKVQDVKTDMQQAIQTQATSMTQKLENVVKQKKSEIFQTVKNLIPQQEIDFFNAMKGFMPKMEEIRREIQIRFDYIEGLATNLQDTLQKFSNRITKVKTDLDVKHQNLVTQVRYLQRNRDDNNGRFITIGKCLGVQAEMINLLTCISMSGEIFRKKPILNAQVFVSFFDGFVYEIKQNLKEDESITYRKKGINKVDLLRYALTCFLSYEDSMFNEEFLGWKLNKPSNLFKISMQEQMEHEKAKQEQRNSVSLSPLDDVKSREQPSLMTINTDRDTIPANSTNFSRTTDALKKMTNPRGRYEDMNSTRIRILPKK